MKKRDRGPKFKCNKSRKRKYRKMSGGRDIGSGGNVLGLSLPLFQSGTMEAINMLSKLAGRISSRSIV